MLCRVPASLFGDVSGGYATAHRSEQILIGFTRAVSHGPNGLSGIGPKNSGSFCEAVRQQANAKGDL